MPNFTCVLIFKPVTTTPTLLCSDRGCTEIRPLNVVSNMNLKSAAFLFLEETWVSRKPQRHDRKAETKNCFRYDCRYHPLPLGLHPRP